MKNNILFKTEWQYKKFILMITTALLVSTILSFAAPLIIKYMFDNYEKLNNLAYLFAVFFGVFTLSYVFKIITIKIRMNFAYRFRVNESKKIYNNIFNMKYEILNSKEPSYLVQKNNLCINALSDFFSKYMSEFLISAITIVVCLIFVSQINIYIFITFFLLLPLQYFGYRKLNYKLSDRTAEFQDIYSSNFKNILSTVSKVDFIKQSGDYNSIVHLIENDIEEIEISNRNINKLAQNMGTILDFAEQLLHNVIYICTTYAYVNKNITLSDMIFITLVSSLYFQGLSKIVQTTISLRDLKGALKFLKDDVLKNAEQDGKIELKNINEIKFDVKNVGYEDILIKSGNFTVKKGETVGIIGKSGCGKSTLMKGLIKLIDVDSFYINDVNLKEYINASLRKKISYFSQQTPIFPASIRENILAGRTSNLEVLKDKDFMKKFYNMKDGLDTIIKENGANLSGGDKQKIALARLYTENPEVIILDEVTNSIDKETAVDMIFDIKKYFGDRIIFIISHDDYAARFCDEFVKIYDKNIQLKTM